MKQVRSEDLSDEVWERIINTPTKKSYDPKKFGVTYTTVIEKGIEYIVPFCGIDEGRTIKDEGWGNTKTGWWLYKKIHVINFPEED